jgi:hypothetical protein
MTDILISLYTMIKNGWSLTDPALNTIGNAVAEAGKDVHLTTGWYEEALQNPQITITPVWGNEHFSSVGYSSAGETELVDLGVWVQIQRATGGGQGNAKAVAEALKEELKRIVRANKRLDTLMLQLGDWRFIPEEDAEPTVLHWALTLKAESYKAVP